MVVIFLKKARQNSNVTQRATTRPERHTSRFESLDDLDTSTDDFGGGTYNPKKAWKVIDRSRQVTASEVDRKCHYHLILSIGSDC